ncbi:TRAP transporter small permease [Ornithinimicrobium avium]|uniref:TRAP transporter small permease n=1 Tax=Ornithinimicrobium avium TaxID=2283195 RepID=A0A345NNQ8_9MICO|nr:TRAP transporter small permease [Ornithinimicrobium avium]
MPVGPRWLSVPLDALDKVLRVLLTVFMAVMLLAALTQVFVRYALPTTLIGPEEIARYMMIGGTFLALPVLARARNHIAVDALAHYLPGGRSRRWLERLILVLEIVFLGLFSWYAGVVVRDAVDTGGFSAGLQIPNWIPMLPLVVGAVLGLVVTAALLAQSFLSGVTFGNYDVAEQEPSA